MNQPNLRAYLTGTALAPAFALYFPWGAKHAANGMDLADWIKKAPGRRWNPERKCWMLTGLGPDKAPEALLQKAGFQIDMSNGAPDESLDASFSGVWDLNELTLPVVTRSPVSRRTAFVYPRLAGWEHVNSLLGAGAEWNKKEDRFEIPVTDLLLHGEPRHGLHIEKQILVDAREFLKENSGPRVSSQRYDAATIAADTSSMAASTGIGSGHDADAMARLAEVVGDFPDWFGMTPRPYQHIGALAMIAGHALMADPTGLGKGSPSWVKILTPTGWTTYGDVQVGDRVVGSNGKPAKVTGVYPRGKLRTYRVRFDDGSSVVVDGDHLWTTDDGYGIERTRDTRTIAQGVELGIRYFLPRLSPVEFEGSGPRFEHSGEVTLGHLPEDVLVASVERRSAALEAFLDAGADDLWSTRRSTFESGLEWSADRLVDLARSLGRWATKAPVGDRWAVHVAYDNMKSRRIVAVERARVEEVICISVDAKDRLYVTEDYLLTHNTVQLIGSMAVRNVKRGVIICPPIVVTHWGNEIERCNLAHFPPKPLTKKQLKELEKAEKRRAAAPAEVTAASPHTNPGDQRTVAPPTAGAAARSGDPESSPILTSPTSVLLPQRESTRRLGPPNAQLVVISATRKEPELPEEGIVVVPDSLLASRPGLLAKLIAWNPDGVAYDEAHRARNWTSKRAEAAMSLYDNLAPGALRIASTATPIFSSPHDLAPLLAMTGHLDSVFGGKSAYYERYTKRNHFNKIVPRNENLAELQDLLRAHVWVRRKKEEVLPDLPKKSRDAMFVDVDLKEFKLAHNEVIEKIMLWLDDQYLALGHLPNEETAEAWARTQIGLMSPLRVAAGMSKVPAAVDYCSAWIDAETVYERGSLQPVERPLIVWAHHHDVFDALTDAMKEKYGDRGLIGIIDGAMTPKKRGEVAADFQAGKYPVLLCSISAAGVGITLTRSSDVLFIESDYSVPTISQAEDRVHRIGQEQPVQIRTMVATGTLDARLHDILARKAVTIDAVTGDASGVHVETHDSGLSPSTIIVELMKEAAAKWKPASQRLPAAS